MPRKIAFWGATGLVAIWALFAGFTYVTNAPQSVENFRHVGYPQQLRILLGIAKLAGAIVLVLPRLPMLKEWAYAGFTFTWIAAIVAHYLRGRWGLGFDARRVAGAAGGFIRHASGGSARCSDGDRCWRSARLDAGVWRVAAMKAHLSAAIAAIAILQQSAARAGRVGPRKGDAESGRRSYSAAYSGQVHGWRRPHRRPFHSQRQLRASHSSCSWPELERHRANDPSLSQHPRTAADKVHRLRGCQDAIVLHTRRVPARSSGVWDRCFHSQPRPTRPRLQARGRWAQAPLC